MQQLDELLREERRRTKAAMKQDFLILTAAIVIAAVVAIARIWVGWLQVEALRLPQTLDNYTTPCYSSSVKGVQLHGNQ